MPKTAQVSVTTTKTLVVPELIGDQSVYLHSSSGTLYIGGADLTTANGYRLDNGDKITIMVGDHEALYAITASGTANLFVMTQINSGQKRENTMSEQLKAAGLSYLRAAVSCVGALYLSGITDPKTLANAFIAGLVGPLLKALAPSEKQYGIGSN